MEFWIVIEQEYGEDVRAFNCLQMARDYAKEYNGIVRIERHVMNLGYQGTEDLEVV